MKKLIILLVVILLFSSIEVIAKDKKQTVDPEFKQFWQEFQIAIKAIDENKLIELCNMPITKDDFGNVYNLCSNFIEGLFIKYTNGKKELSGLSKDILSKKTINKIEITNKFESLGGESLEFESYYNKKNLLKSPDLSKIKEFYKLYIEHTNYYLLLFFAKFDARYKVIFSEWGPWD